MFKKSLALGAIVASLFATSANAAIFLDFEGSQDGALIGSFYNGGTDSFGNRGVNYGLSFNTGATVRVDNGRTYLSNVTSIFALNGIANGATFLYSTFNRAGTSPNTADTYDLNARLSTDPDPSYWTYLGNTYDRRCDAYPDTFCNFDAGFADVVGSNKAFMLSFGAPTAGSANPFNWLALDSVTLGVTPILSGPDRNIPTGTFIGDNATAEVPEPTTTALFGLGLLGVFAAARRRKA